MSNKDDERLRKTTISFLKDFAKQGYENAVECIDWLEKQGEKKPIDDNIITRDDEILQAISVGLTNVFEDLGWSDFGGLPIEEIQEWLEKQGEQKEYTFKSIPRLLEMIEPSDRAKAYCQKLIDTFAKKGYNTDAKIVEEVLRGWNGEDVPMAVMDEQKPINDTDEEIVEAAKNTSVLDMVEPMQQKNVWWSEEDEGICNAIINDIANAKSLCKYEISKGICDAQINWLKSLKQRMGG